MIVERECKSVVFVGDGGGRKWGRERDERVVWECEGGGGYIGRIRLNISLILDYQISRYLFNKYLDICLGS